MAINRGAQQHGVFRRRARIIDRQQGTRRNLARQFVNRIHIRGEHSKVGTIQTADQTGLIRAGLLQRTGHPFQQGVGGFTPQLLVQLDEIGKPKNEQGADRG